MKNYYNILAVARDASQEEIKKNYRRLSKQYHPDLHPGNKETESKFKEITEAYSVLSNPEERANYDGKLREPGKNENFQKRETTEQPQYSPGEFNINNVNIQFEKFFGFDPQTGEKRKSSTGANQGKKGPLDVSGIFEDFFKPKKN